MVSHTGVLTQWGARWLARGLAAWLLALLAAHAAAGEASVAGSIDRDTVNEGESLVVTYSAQSADDDPDFSPLQTDFEVLGTTRRSDLTLINGRFSKSTTWQLNLRPKRSGELQIPPIHFGDDVSPVLTIMVNPAAAGAGREADAGLFFEVQATPERPFVQQQILYTARLYAPQDIELVETEFGAPAISGGDALVVALGKARDVEEWRDDTRYRIIEGRFAVFPQRNGRVTIGPIVFEGQVIEGAASLLNPFSQAIRTHRVSSAAVTIEVRPIPAEFQGNHWLPARSLTLHETWSDDSDRLPAGEPVTRTLSLLVEGLTAGQLPEFATADIARLKVYPGAPTLDDQYRGDGVTGLRQEKLGIIATANGTYTLPELRVPWWNTETNRMEEAVLPARTLRVQGAASTAARSPAATEPAVTTTLPAISMRKTGASWWPWISALLGAGWTFTLLAWGWSRRPASAARPPRSPDRRRLAEQVIASSRQHNAAATRTALLQWAGAGSKQATLESVAARYPALAEAIDALNQALFGEGAAPWRGDCLAEMFASVSRQAEHNGAPVGVPMSLVPLYLSTDHPRR
ncbi:MAG: BatD family protein [Chromatiales bacterium]